MLQINQLVLGRYRVTEIIAFCGQADVAKAVDHHTGDTVAVKQLALAPGSRNYPAERAGRLHIPHPAIVNPIDYGEECGELYAISPFIAGIDLDTHVHRAGSRLNVPQAIAIATELAGALSVVQAQGIVHRGIKPANILITAGERVRLIDFDIARNLRERTITTGTGLLGTPMYVAPEQAASPASVEGRADLSALGAVLYFMLVGVPPFHGNTAVEILRAATDGAPVPPRQIDPCIPEPVDRACLTALAKCPAERYQTADEFRLALLAASPASATGSFCPACGDRVLPGPRFCPACGAGLAPDLDTTHWLACGCLVGEGAACPSCRRSFGPSEHRLHFFAEALAGHVFRVPEGEYVVGRPQLLPRDQHISRQHLRVACRNGAVHVQDTGSTNRMYVAGRRADAWLLLAPGQEVDVAHNRATYSNAS